ncbi:Sec-independent protein translocase protein TatB [Gordonia neofelifaecis]|uniref:Sec-independent protein translocase protein TatB n=1 Tax=Gordonia neofelifaecis NRRL B-59395 TaxID=644548 RepID=F1YFA7_9ACTN|nr:Sec-independent protein translocase protein TatB [Gordonia neofelifaecis]EGD56646.1 sec-independent translocase [Gordonia neofelifaecis NRRL B-59395]
MFSSVGWGELLILLAAALIILGPERLPGAVTWAMGSLRKVRDYATGASSQLRDEMGPEFDQLREPLSQLNELRQMSPKSIVTKHIFDGDSSPIDDMSKSVRDTLDISRTVPKQQPSTPAVAPKEPDTPRKHDVTDWDAT